MDSHHHDIQPTLGMVLEAREMDKKDAIDELLKVVPIDQDTLNDPRKLEAHKDNLRQTLNEILDGKRSPQDRWICRLCKMVGMVRQDGQPDKKQMKLVLGAMQDVNSETTIQRAPRRIQANIELLMSSVETFKPAVIEQLKNSFTRFLDHQERLKKHKVRKKKRLFLKVIGHK